MPVSALSNSNGVVSCTVSCNGSPISAEIKIVSVEIIKSVNRISTAVLVIGDGDMPSGSFPVSDTDTFKPGTEIEIQLGYSQQTNSVFTGVITKHSVKIMGPDQARLVVECKDPAIAMTVARKNANFFNKSDKDVFQALIGEYTALRAKISFDSATKHTSLVQFNVSDWDFMITRAEANGLLVSVDAGVVNIAAPSAAKEAALKVTYGIDLIDFSADLDARYQYSSVTACGWDLASQQIQEGSASTQALTKQGNIDGSTLADVLGVTDYRLQSGAPQDVGFLTTWAKAQQTKSELARIRGHVSFQGSHLAKVAELIELAGVGERFNGRAFISSVCHTFEDGNWVTRVEFGLSPNWFSEVNQLAAPQAAGLAPGIGGLHIGLVTQLKDDPESQYKIKVSIPEMAAAEGGFWARLSHFYGSNGVGAFFIPEIGDEVVLGFFNDDPAHPVVLGSLYSSKNLSPYELTAENNTKALVTRSKMKIEFDEKKKFIRLLTPGNNIITISDDDKAITLEDQNQNKLTLDSNGITLDSPKDIKLSAKGKITLNAVNNIEATANADIKHTGLNISHTANLGFTAKASATAEVSASGTTTVKGSLVMIN